MGTCSTKVSPQCVQCGQTTEEIQVLVYADDGYIKAKLSVALQVLTELKHVLKQDTGLELNISKTTILPKSVTAQAAFDGCRTSYKLPPR